MSCLVPLTSLQVGARTCCQLTCSTLLLQKTDLHLTDAPAAAAGLDMQQLRTAIQQKKVHPEDVRIFMGDCQWSAGQLQQEMARGTWVAVKPDRAWLQYLAMQPPRSHRGR